MTHVKMRSFIPPGATLALDAELAPRAAEATLKLSARMDDRIAATARLEVVRAEEREREVSPMRRRVAITGIGLVTPVGNDVATTWDALLAGRSGGAAISLFDASGFPVRIAAEVKDFRDDEYVDRKLHEIHEPLAPLRARRGRAGVSRRRAATDTGDRDAVGLRGRRAA